MKLIALCSTTTSVLVLVQFALPTLGEFCAVQGLRYEGTEMTRGVADYVTPEECEDACALSCRHWDWDNGVCRRFRRITGVLDTGRPDVFGGSKLGHRAKGLTNCRCVETDVEYFGGHTRMAKKAKDRGTCLKECRKAGCLRWSWDRVQKHCSLYVSINGRVVLHGMMGSTMNCEPIYWAKNDTETGAPLLEVVGKEGGMEGILTTDFDRDWEDYDDLVDLEDDAAEVELGGLEVGQGGGDFLEVSSSGGPQKVVEEGGAFCSSGDGSCKPGHFPGEKCYRWNTHLVGKETRMLPRAEQQAECAAQCVAPRCTYWKWDSLNRSCRHFVSVSSSRADQAGHSIVGPAGCVPPCYETGVKYVGVQTRQAVLMDSAEACSTACRKSSGCSGWGFSDESCNHYVTIASAEVAPGAVAGPAGCVLGPPGIA